MTGGMRERTLFSSLRATFVGSAWSFGRESEIEI